MLAYGRARWAVSQKLYREKITFQIPKVPPVYLRLKWYEYGLQFYPGGGGTPGNSWWGRATRFSGLTLFQTKICHFSLPFSDLASKIHNRFQTWPLRNYVIITQIRTPTKKISFFIIYLKLKQWIRSYITVGSSKPVPDSRPKWAKTTRFKIKTAQ